jgi:hypothetical protein
MDIGPQIVKKANKGILQQKKGPGRVNLKHRPIKTLKELEREEQMRALKVIKDSLYPMMQRIPLVSFSFRFQAF